MRFRLGDWVERNLTVIERHGPEWVTVCPACGRSKMAIHVGRKAFQCLSAHCRFRGWRPVKLVAATHDLTDAQAAELIAAFSMGAVLGPVQPLTSGAAVRRTGPLPSASLPLVDWRLRPDQAAYVQGRGITAENAAYFGLGTIVSDGSGSKADYALSGRVIFPVWDRSGLMVWWVARAIRESRAKTINMPRSCREPDHGAGCTCYHESWGLPGVASAATADEVVLGLHLIRPGDRVIVVEGPVDAAVCGPGFVATMRAWISHEQAALIAASGASEAVILFDGDKAGEEGARRSLPVLSAALPTRIATCPAGEDPGSLGRDRAIQAADQATSQGGIQQLQRGGYVQVDGLHTRPPYVEGLKAPKSRSEKR
jgi:hypothetical protein